MKQAEALSEAGHGCLERILSKKTAAPLCESAGDFRCQGGMSSLLASDVHANVKERRPSAACGELSYTLPEAPVDS